MLGAQKNPRICCTPRAWDDSFVGFLTGHGDPSTSGLFPGRVEYSAVECCIRPAPRCSFRVASTSSVKIGFMRCGRETIAALPSATKISNGTDEQEPTSVLSLGKTSGILERTSPKRLIAKRF